ncbi:MAG: response regulator [Desulfobacteraceae bacterium]|nr:response regulator [Desulfobacteraceae bacterium]
MPRDRQPIGSKMKKILVVDDEEPIRRLISDILEMEGYDCVTAGNAKEARTCLEQHNFQLILSDINMPGESGLDFMRYVFKKYKDIAAIMVTAMEDPQVAEAVFEIGVYDYITKPVSRSSVLISVANALNRRDLEISNRSYRDGLEKMVAERTISLEQTMAQLRKAMQGIIHTISLTVETRDPYTAGHQKRVADLAKAIALEMALTDEAVEATYLAGLIHDLGKISIPAEILSKPGKLTQNEFNLIKDHPQTGYDILKDIEFHAPIALMVLQHHERYDGSGYPGGLSNSQTLLESRIIAVADVVEAIASHRPYRAALGIDIALKEISKGVGTLYDPDVAKVCLNLFAGNRFTF